MEDGLLVRSDTTMEQGRALHKPSGDVYHLLGQLLNKYTTRELRGPADYIPAMAGICRRLADYAQCSLLFGIPVPALDWFLLFYPNKNGLKRRDVFPSWAWSGWYGQVYYNYGSGNVTKWVAASTWVIWHKREPSGELTTVRDEAERPARKASELFGHLFDVSRTDPSRELSCEGLSRYRYAVLQFWTISVNFALRRVDQEEGENLMWSSGLYWTQTTCELLNKDGSSCGFVTLDNPTPQNEESGSGEFILLSLSAEKEQNSAHLEHNTQATDPEGRFFWVLMVEWDNGVAERKGIGKVHRDALASSLDPGVSWKEIILA